MQGKFLVVTKTFKVVMKDGFDTRQAADKWKNTAHGGYYEDCIVIPNRHYQK